MDLSRKNFTKKNSCFISGADLCKFFDRPVETNPKIGDIIEVEDESTLIFYEPKAPFANKFVSTSTQTDYRESEAQTDPWDPPFKVTKVLKEPEVLSIRNFSFDSGLPAGPLEVNYISELRKNKKLKTEVETSERRKQIICDQIRNEWNYKISVLNKKQLEKLTAMKSSLVDEMRKYSDKKEKILTNLWIHKMMEMNKQNSKLQLKFRKEKHNLESEIFSSKGSDILKPVDLSERRIPIKSVKTKAPVSQGTEYMLSNYYLTNPAGLSSVKSWLESKTDDLKTEIPISRAFNRSQKERLAEQAYQNILEKKRSKLPPKIYHEDYVKEEPPVPTVKAEDVIEFFDFEEKKIDLVTVLQKALRGFACQKQMLELIDCHKEGLSTILSPLYPEITDS